VGAVIVVTACFRSETRAIAPRDGVRIVHTAMGARAADRLESFASLPPSLVLSTGFCGGLAHDLRAGDIVIADEIRSAGGSVRVDAALLAAARAALNARGLPSHVGSVECTDDVAGPEQKEALGAGGAIAVDLESGPLARWAGDHGVPFLSCRAVLDTVDEPVVFSTRVPVWATVARHPLVAIRVGRAARAAADQIGKAVDCLLDALEERR